MHENKLGVLQTLVKKQFADAQTTVLVPKSSAGLCARVPVARGLVGCSLGCSLGCLVAWLVGWLLGSGGDKVGRSVGGASNARVKVWMIWSPVQLRSLNKMCVNFGTHWCLHNNGLPRLSQCFFTLQLFFN